MFAKVGFLAFLALKVALTVNYDLEFKILVTTGHIGLVVLHDYGFLLPPNSSWLKEEEEKIKQKSVICRPALQVKTRSAQKCRPILDQPYSSLTLTPFGIYLPTHSSTRPPLMKKSCSTNFPHGDCTYQRTYPSFVVFISPILTLHPCKGVKT